MIDEVLETSHVVRVPLVRIYACEIRTRATGRLGEMLFVGIHFAVHS